MIKAAIVGSTGYVGEELIRLLVQHPQVEIIANTSNSFKDKPFSSVYHNFKNIFSACCSEENIEQLAEEADVLFLGLPHGIASKKINKKIIEKCVVIDAGADFRIKSQNVYEEWYQTKHESPDLLEEAVYGLCEIKRAEIKNSRLIANPGCYTTCTILSLYPLVKEGIIDTNSIIVDAKSGATGAGRSLNLGTHFTECNESIKAYKIASHRHTPEIEQELSNAANDEINLIFTPHLIPMQRGILSTCYAKLKSNSISYKDLQDLYLKYYGNEYFIRITEEETFPESKWVRNSNYCDIGFKIDKRTGNIVVIGTIDNLIKGAAGQAVQNMNIVFGIKEQTGLETVPVSI